MTIGTLPRLTPSLALTMLVSAKKLGHRSVAFLAEEWAELSAEHQDVVQRLAARADVRVEIIA